MSAADIQRTISVTGVGRAAAAADILLLSLAVDTQAVTTSDALAANNKQATAVLSALKATMSPDAIFRRLNSASIQ